MDQPNKFAMRLAIISHKVCWQQTEHPGAFSTDGGFPLQIQAISELFEGTRVVVPCAGASADGGASRINGHQLKLVPLTVPTGTDWRRKLGFPVWLLKNGKVIWREVRQADAVHTPIPGDIGTIGMLFALIQRKPLFVRHCGNWFVQRTLAERVWKWSMERFAGGRNVMLATGGSPEPPSKRNDNIKWIFSTSLRRDQILGGTPRTIPDDGSLRIVIACRQEPRKGTDVVIESMPAILKNFPKASLDVIGDGSQLDRLKELSSNLGLNGAVRFHGRLGHQAVLEVLDNSHIFCFPTNSEGFPKAVLEALATGLPVVTTPVSVLPELIGQGGGVLIDEPLPALLAGAVNKICSDPDRYSESSRKAITTAKQYSLEEWQRQMGAHLSDAWGVPLANEVQPAR